MKVITLWQPWATLVIIGAKRFETRHWSTRYRGPLGMHAAKRTSGALRDLCRQEPFRSVLAEAGYDGFDALPLGALLGTVRLVDVFKVDANGRTMHSTHLGARAIAPLPEGDEAAFGDFAPGRYTWYLDSLERYPDPLPCRGAQGIFDVDPSDLQAGRAPGAFAQTGLGL
jgi:hypothetical protein